MHTFRYKASSKIDLDVVSTAVSKLSDADIQKMASETPDLYYKWCVDTYTALRKAKLEVEFQSALLEKLQRCDPQAQPDTAYLVEEIAEVDQKRRAGAEESIAVN